LYSQTTRSIETFKLIIKQLQNQGIKVKIKETICKQVANRGRNIVKFCKKYNKIIFISGINSSNGKMLYNICKLYNPNTYFINSISQIQKEWFNTNDTVGISGATSTPIWLIKEVQKYLINL
ncbi:MAG TPA: 4-hydroxy-3-methylbut-2-enyl diphosphate reductase, partial [Bacteroidales bacterium]|nr:4-hydroxy-3-methylbut-2-enyl diphosphate reductase [Bacteroidales bacterium]